MFLIPPEALYPFGYGLSYTSFAYGGLKAEVNGTDATVFVEVRNTGLCAGCRGSIAFLRCHKAV